MHWHALSLLVLLFTAASGYRASASWEMAYYGLLGGVLLLLIDHARREG